jgi:MFS transporter, DHA1 family, multidrug resistance protein
MYALIGAAPFILVRRFGYSVDQVGPLLALATVGIWIGSIAASHLIRRIAADRMLALGAGFVTCSSFALLALTLTDRLTMPELIAVMSLFLIGVALSGPPAAALAMEVNPLATGSGSGLYGSAQMGIGALCSLSTSLAADPARGATLTVSIAAAIGLCGILMARLDSRQSEAG